MLTLAEIQEKNRTNTSLLDTKIKGCEYPQDLVQQCRTEYETFVRPIVEKVLARYLE